MSERKLVTIREVAELREIPGADAIETAVVDGWAVVVKKGEFKVGDKGVYFEIDSFLPLSDPRFAFLANKKTTFNGVEGARLRTIKLRGQLSQGLLLTLRDFPELENTDVGADYAAILGVTKWEAPVPAQLSGKVKGFFPTFLRKTDQERIQNMTWVFEREKDSLFEVTVKLDGSSCTIFHDRGEVGVCSRNIQLEETEDNLFWKVARKTGLLDALPKLGRNIAVQGELMGPNVQGNREKLTDHQLYVFDIFDIDRQEYLPLFEREILLSVLSRYGATLKTVPLFIPPVFLGDIESIDTLLDAAEGPSLNQDIPREGLVFKRVDGKLSFKVISNSYLLKAA